MDKQTCFWEKVDKSQDCWLWTGRLNPDGYGTSTRIEGETFVHRISYTLLQGSIPDGMCVLHTCDIRNCVNPSHLFTGTRADNCRDRSAKGRTVGSHCYGETNGKAKLTDEQVEQIRLLYKPKQDVGLLAKQFGISHSTLINIAVGRRRFSRGTLRQGT